MKTAKVKQYTLYKTPSMLEWKEEFETYSTEDTLVTQIDIKDGLLRVVQKNEDGDMRVLWFSDFNLEETI